MPAAFKPLRVARAPVVIVAVTFPVVAAESVLAFVTLIAPSSSVSACAPTPENLLLLPTSPFPSIIVLSSVNVPDIAVTLVRLISAVLPGFSKALKFVLKVSTAPASPIVPDSSTSTILVLLVKLFLSVINCSTSVIVPVNLTTVLILIEPPPAWSTLESKVDKSPASTDVEVRVNASASPFAGESAASNPLRSLSVPEATVAVTLPVVA